jgi:Spy/CpxP family protein refolding chaperone
MNMTIKKQFAGALLVMAMSMTGVAAAQQYGPPPGYAQGPGGGWDAPPPEFAAAQQRGFRDGIEGARKDFENHRPPNVNNRDEFRNPHFIAPPDRRDYRFGFRRGYDVAVRHMYGPGRR